MRARNFYGESHSSWSSYYGVLVAIINNSGRFFSFVELRFSYVLRPRDDDDAVSFLNTRSVVRIFFFSFPVHFSSESFLFPSRFNRSFTRELFPARSSHLVVGHGNAPPYRGEENRTVPVDQTDERPGGMDGVDEIEKTFLPMSSGDGLWVTVRVTNFGGEKKTRGDISLCSRADFSSRTATGTPRTPVVGR